MKKFEPTTFEEWKNSDLVKDDSFLLDFVTKNLNLFKGFLVGEDSVFTYQRFQTLEEVVSLLENKISGGFNNYLYSLENTDIFTPENYTEEQRSVFEKEKNNFSGKYSKEFLDLPKVSMYTLKGISLKKK